MERRNQVRMSENCVLDLHGVRVISRLLEEWLDFFYKLLAACCQGFELGERRKPAWWR